MMQATNRVLMVRPAAFDYNSETAESNSFMHKPEGIDKLQERVLVEFDQLVQLLQSNGVIVEVFEDYEEDDTPDSIFPNNWISTHCDGKMVLYPMSTPSRRKERKPRIFNTVKQKFGFQELIDLSHLEEENIFLESTGCLIFDRPNAVAYCALSPRANLKAINEWQYIFPNYETVVFNALDKAGDPIYHTNVMMAIGEKIAIICLESIHNKDERRYVSQKLQTAGKEIIEISLEQVYSFAGNMLELKDKDGCNLLLMSSVAYQSLDMVQKEQIQKHNRIIHTDVSTIEHVSGGSVRCMVCELFTPA